MHFGDESLDNLLADGTGNTSDQYHRRTIDDEVQDQRAILRRGRAADRYTHQGKDLFENSDLSYENNLKKTR